MKTKLAITNHTNSYELTVTRPDETKETYIYFNALELAYGIVLHAFDNYRDEVDLDAMRNAIYDHGAHQELFNKQIADTNRLLSYTMNKRDKYREQRNELRKEITQLTKKLKQYETE